MQRDIPLNDYQLLMRNVSKLTPYNAVHAVAIHDYNLHLDSLQQVVTLVVQQLGLGSPEFSKNDQYVYFIDFAQAIQINQCSLAPEVHIANEINSKFTDCDLPLRFFLLEYHEKMYFAITYDHWIADAYSIVRLMETIFSLVSNKKHPSLYLLNNDIKEYFPTIYSYKQWYYRGSGLLRKLIECSQAYRTPMTSAEATNTGCSLYFFTDEELAGLLRVCKAHKITVNDCFIAILAKLFGELTVSHRMKVPRKFLKGRRDRIVISVIANIRQQSRSNLQYAFGLLLGFFSLSFKTPERYSIIQLCQNVSRQTKKIKQQQTAVKQYLLLKIQNLWWKWTTEPQKRYKLFTKNTPITVGISNMNLNVQDWSFPSMIDDYIRCSPTGVVCPIIFNITTLNHQMSVAISYRKACYTEEEVIILKGKYLDFMRAFIRT
jgi:NRPS condensation-like uncharacterized protein